MVQANGRPIGESPSGSELLACASQVASSLKRLSWRRRRDYSVWFCRSLKECFPPDVACRAAKRMFGVAPEMWLTISEARIALRKLGVKMYDRRLYRLRRKVTRPGSDMVKVKVDRQGNWDGLDSNELRDPVATVTVRTSGPIHFQVSRFMPKA